METPVIEHEEEFEGEYLNAAEETLEDVKRVINGDMPIFTPPKRIIRKVMDESEKAETEFLYPKNKNSRPEDREFCNSGDKRPFVEHFHFGH